MNYGEYFKRPRSEKITLVTADAVMEVKLFDLVDDNVYRRLVDHFVVGVKDGGVHYSRVGSQDLQPGEYYFEPTSKTLYLRTMDDSDPKTRSISLDLRFFWSNAPLALPFDLNNGEVVEWEGRIRSIGNLGQQLDDQNTGIVLESSSTVVFENNDGYFDEIFDSLIWENQKIIFYSWSPGLEISEVKKLFDGVIESKDFSTSSVTFKVKDFVFRLKDFVSLSLFSELDGRVTPSLIGRAKRRIYGQTKQLRCAGLDNILGGFQISGTISFTEESKDVYGVSTQFLSELSPGDELEIEVRGEIFKFGVESILSNTHLIVGSKARLNLPRVTANCRPSIPFRRFNRRWHIAGHKLRSPATVITEVVSNNRIKVLSTTDLFSGDLVKINDDYAYIRRVTGNLLVLRNAITPPPSNGDIVFKSPVSRAYLGDKEMFIGRDWNVLNEQDDAILELDPMAEFNIVDQKSIGPSLQFTNGSREVTTSSAVDLRTIISPRDWIRKDSVLDDDWYEVLDVSEQTIHLRTTFAGTTQLSPGLYKPLAHAADDSLVTVDCMGLEVDGQWIRTASDAVRHLILNDANFDSVNEDTFIKARAECGHTLSLPIPETLGGKIPQIKEVISKINESVFGSLYGDSSWAISYSILNSKKPENFFSLKDDDIISFDVVSEQKIINSIRVNYCPFTDIFTGQDAFEVYTENSEFVDRLIGIKNTDERTVYLFDREKAKIMAQRILFFRSLSSCKVIVKAKMNLADISVNDKVYLELDRLYKRYGGRDRRKIGIVTAVKKNGFDTEVEFTDLGNIYNRVPSIAPNGSLPYDLADRNDIARWGYVLDNLTLTPQVLSESELGNNLIG